MYKMVMHECGILLKCPHVSLHYFFGFCQAVAENHYATYKNVTLQALRTEGVFQLTCNGHFPTT